MTIILLLAILGFVVGSFIGALTWRLPRGLSPFFGRSFCDRCRTKIAWFDNIPLFSFFWLKARCRCCHRRISWRYPAIELASGIGFAVLAVFHFPLIFFLIFVLTLAILIIDLEKQIIPDQLVFAGFFLIFLVYLLTDFRLLFISLVAGFGAGVFLLLLHLATRGQGMGLGDVKFTIFAGLILGWPAVLVWLLSAFILGALVGITLILAKKKSFGQKIAFGPYLVLALWFTILMTG